MLEVAARGGLACVSAIEFSSGNCVKCTVPQESSAASIECRVAQPPVETVAVESKRTSPIVAKLSSVAELLRDR